MILNSNSTLKVTGAIYAPAANLILNSNSFSDVYSIMVANTITINSNSALNFTVTTSVFPTARR